MPVKGLILCGGQSSRMGIDKAFISYHGMPQWEYLHQQLSPFCDEVFISCQLAQAPLFPKGFSVIQDHSQFKDAGPMTGLLSAFETVQGHSWIVVGCDYPLINSQDFSHLVSHIESDSQIVCFRNPVTGIDEPLIAWYSSSVYETMASAYHNGETSLRLFMSSCRLTRIIPDEWNRLFSVDTPEQREQLRNNI